ncbi:MAG: hypothetical protein ACO3RV_05135 [Luteolibacter sp.]
MLRAPGGRTTIKQAAIASGMRWADSPVMNNARVEWPAWLREQSISQTRHRYGNLVTSPASLRDRAILTKDTKP